MRTLYLELNMGAAGDMLSAALFELLTDEQKHAYLDKVGHLGLDGVSVRADRMEKCGISGTHMTVLVDDQEEMDAAAHEHDEDHKHAAGHDSGPGHDHAAEQGEDHEHCHHYHHHHTSLAHISETILAMDLDEAVKSDALSVYDLLAGAESHAHGVDVREIHFHEVGEKDAIVDIVSVCLLMHMLKPDRVIASPAATGSGQVHCAHGILPVPAPATAYLLERKGIPCFAGQEKGELLTPTGAALIGYFADSFGKMPVMTIKKTGYGMGKKDFQHANCLRAILGGDFQEETEDACDSISELSCNLDDMTPEDIAFAQEKIFAAGALDVFTAPIGMKKGRPGIMLTALCHEEQKGAVIRAFFAYTATLGVREKICGRYIMRSAFTKVELKRSDLEKEHGASGKAPDEVTGEIPDDPGEDPIWIDVKRSAGYGAVRMKPEFDQVREAAEKTGVPTKIIREAVLSKLSQQENTRDDV